MLTELEYKECRYIDNEMKFYTLDSFIQNAGAIKRLYKCLNHKIFYKWYVYSNIHTSLKRKNMIWSYLNDDLTLEQLINLTK